MSESQLPSVSVVIATRNRPELLRKALDAIVTQAYAGQVDVVIAFDGTEPETELEMTSANRSVRVMNNQRTQGLPGGRNTGITSTTGEFIAFCDDDDEWLPGKLQAQVDFLQSHPAAQFCTTGVVINFEGEMSERPSPVSELTVEMLVHDRTTEAHPSCFLFRRSLLDHIGLVDEVIPGGYSEDYDFLLKAARVAPVACIAKPFVMVRWGRTSYFTTRWRTIVDAQRYLMSQHPEFAQHRKAEARINGQIAFALAALGERREAISTIGRVIRRWPLEKRWPIAAAVTCRLLTADRALELAHKAGRGI
jgi:glycosyltransferase involved in cell wall biosynthesis